MPGREWFVPQRSCVLRSTSIPDLHFSTSHSYTTTHNQTAWLKGDGKWARKWGHNSPVTWERNILHESHSSHAIICDRKPLCWRLYVYFHWTTIDVGYLFVHWLSMVIQMQPKCHKAWHFSSLSCVGASKVLWYFPELIAFTPFFLANILTAFKKSFPHPWTMICTWDMDISHHDALGLQRFAKTFHMSTCFFQRTRLFLASNNNNDDDDNKTSRPTGWLPRIYRPVPQRTAWRHEVEPDLVTKGDERWRKKRVQHGSTSSTPASTIPKMTCQFNSAVPRSKINTANVDGWCLQFLTLCFKLAGSCPFCFEVLKVCFRFVFSLGLRLCCNSCFHLIISFSQWMLNFWSCITVFFRSKKISTMDGVTSVGDLPKVMHLVMQSVHFSNLRIWNLMSWWSYIWFHMISKFFSFISSKSSPVFSFHLSCFVSWSCSLEKRCDWMGNEPMVHQNYPKL